MSVEYFPDNLVVRKGTPEHNLVEIGPSKHASNAVAGAFALAERVIVPQEPTILDFKRYVDIYETLGSRAERNGGALTIDNIGLNSSQPNEELVKKVRASILLLSGTLLKTGYLTMPVPEGDWPGTRPTSSTLDVAEKFGAQISVNDGQITARLDKPKRQDRTVNVEGKVFATLASIIMASGVGGRTTIINPLSSLEVDNLAEFVSDLGVSVTGLDTHNIIVESDGLPKLKKEVVVNIAPDACETMFWLAYAKLHNIHLELSFPGWKKEVNPSNWGPLFDMSKFMYRTHAIIDGNGNKAVIAQQDLRQLEPVDIVAFHDKKGLPRDAAPVLVVLFGALDALSSYYDDKYGLRRVEWMKELVKVGGDVRFYFPQKATIFGNEKGKYIPAKDNTVLVGRDIRSAASLLLAASTSDIPITVSGIDHIKRSYTNLPEKMKLVGTEVITQSGQ